MCQYNCDMTLLNENFSIGGRIILFLYFLVSRIVFGLKLTNNAIFLSCVSITWLYDTYGLSGNWPYWVLEGRCRYQNF